MTISRRRIVLQQYLGLHLFDIYDHLTPHADLVGIGHETRKNRCTQIFRAVGLLAIGYLSINLIAVKISGVGPRGQLGAQDDGHVQPGQCT